MIDTLVNVFSALLTTAFGWWLNARSHDRGDAQAQRAALQVQADALVLAVAELQAAAEANRILWDGRAERWRTGLLVSLASLGGYARVRLCAGGSHGFPLQALAGLGDAARMLSRERLGPKQAAAALTAYMGRIAAAAAPLLRHPAPDVAAATERLMDAVHDVGNPERLRAALEAFGRAVRASLAAPPRRGWRRWRSTPQAE
ncbi:hypothetical protein [Streptomyces klenkii]